MKKVNVVIWGFGAMGRGMAEMLLSKKGVIISGVCDLHPDLVGKSIFNALECEQNDHPEVILTDDIDSLLNKETCDVVLLATDSFTKKAFTKMVKVMEQGINVISTAEEMACTQAQEPELAKELDKVAKANNVTVLGTGINPGFIMDLLVVASKLQKVIKIVIQSDKDSSFI